MKRETEVSVTLKAKVGMKRGPSQLRQPVRDYDKFREAYEEMLRLFETGTKRQFLRAERRFWKIAKDMEIVEGEWWRAPFCVREACRRKSKSKEAA